MFLGVQPKQIGENKRVLLNYVPWLGDVERLSVAGSAAFIQRTDGTPMVAGLDAQIDGPYVMNQRTALAVYVSQGVDGRDYKLTVRGETDQGQIREDEIIVQVREI